MTSSEHAGRGTPVTTGSPVNRPGLDHLDYRVGTYRSFLATMIEQVSRDPRLAAWTARREDYGIALLELGAYVADVVTFYQERIANEAFLRTAVHRESLLRLARLVDYDPAPGVAAVVPLTFTVQKGKHVDVPAGLRVQSVPGQHEKPQKFETVEPLNALSSLNELRPVLTRLARRGDTAALFRGRAAAVRPGEYVAFAGKELLDDPSSDRWDVRRVTTVSPGLEPRTVMLRWDPALGRVRPPAPTSRAPEGYRFREQAWPFGHDAPAVSPLAEWQSAVLRHATTQVNKSLPQNGQVDLPPAYQRQDDAREASFPQDVGHRDHIYLDRVYPAISPGSWVALVTHQATTLAPRTIYTELYRVLEVTEVVHSAYSQTAEVTRVRVPAVEQTRGAIRYRQPENIDFFPVQGTIVLIVSEPLGPAVVPDETAVAGRILTLDGQHPELAPGRTLVVAGSPVTPDGPRAETCAVADVVHGEATTMVTLTAALAGSYRRSSVRIFGNVASATHGETVAAEVIGDGDASGDFLTVGLRKKPVTFVPRAGARHGAAAELVVRVDGIEYAESPTLLANGPVDRVYEHRVEADGSSTVTFGDGEHGAVPPTGRGNITARYRTGLGREGNVEATAIRNLLDRPAGLMAAGNPLPSAGGTDAESSEEIRDNAPNVVRTFGRVVSLTDFEDVARETIGVTKARASMTEEDDAQVAILTVAGEGGATIEGDLLRRLQDELDSRRDRNRRMRVASFKPVHITVGATVVVEGDRLPDEVLARCRSALAAHLSFGHRDFGRPVHLSDVYAVLQAVAGVAGLHVDWLDVVPPGQDTPDVQQAGPAEEPVLHQVVPVAPDELAMVRDEATIVLSAQGAVT